MCILKGCKRVRTYNYDGLHAEYCGQHKLDNMINTRHEKCHDCNFQASFGYIAQNKRVRCRMHKVDGMINLKHKNIRCKGYLCVSCKQPNHNGYCSEKCFISNNLQEYTYNENSGILYKEYLIFKHLKETYPEHNIIWDKIYCCLYRPDFSIAFDGFTVIIEVDEYQHRKYGSENELTRIENIYHTSGIPVYVVRFNPDKYECNGMIIKSPFRYGELIDADNWANRLQELTYTINTCINNGLNDEGPNTYEIIRLFYDA